MTYQGDLTLPEEILEQIRDQGIDFLPELVKIGFKQPAEIRWGSKRFKLPATPTPELNTVPNAFCELQAGVVGSLSIRH